MKAKAVLMILLFISFSFVGCIESRSANVYSRNTAMKHQIAEKGTVESVKQVEIEGTKTPVGAVAGAAAGGVLGSTIGSGRGRTLAIVAGALAGAAGGAVAEEAITSKKGLEIVVKKDNGQTIVVVQEADVFVAAGNWVNIIYANDGTTRVSPI